MRIRIENRSDRVIILKFPIIVRCDIYQTVDFNFNDDELEKFRLYLIDLCNSLEISFKENNQKIGSIKIKIFILK